MKNIIESGELGAGGGLRVFSCADMAGILQVSRGSIYALVRKGRLKPLDALGRFRFSGGELERFIKETR